MDIYDSLTLLQRRRRFYTQRLIAMDNSLLSITRRGLGWQPNLSEAERKVIVTKSQKIVKAARKGEDMNDPELQEIALIVTPEIIALDQARAPLESMRKTVEKDMVKIARDLPVHKWTETVRGFGDKALAVVIGETGDLGNYPNPAKVWRRLGLAPYNGMSGSAWRMMGGLSSDEWVDFGYSGKRLSQVFSCITEPMIKHQSEGLPYRAVYDREKQKFLGRELRPKHAHMHGLRVMTKAVVLDLWRVWHGYSPKHG